MVKKKEKKIVEHNEYESTIQWIFRDDNLIRYGGASIPILAKYYTETSRIESEYININSDILFLLLGVTIMIWGPDIRKVVMNKWGKAKKQESIDSNIESTEEKGET